MNVEEKFNVEGISNQVFEEMKDDGEGFDSFDDYWHRIKLNLRSRGFEQWEVTVLEGLVMKKVEEMFDQAE